MTSNLTGSNFIFAESKKKKLSLMIYLPTKSISASAILKKKLR